MEDWITVRQAAHLLNVSMPRVYALIGNGTIASKKLGLTTLVSRRSVESYASNPNRNKYASKPLRKDIPLDPTYTMGELEALGQERLELEDGSPKTPPSLTSERRRPYVSIFEESRS